MKTALIDNKIKNVQTFLVVMQMAAWQELTFSCLSVQAAPLAASR